MCLNLFRVGALRSFALLAICVACLSQNIFAQSNVNVRVMAANLNGNTQSYQPFALRILQGLQPDVVCIQEFNYASTNGVDVNTPLAMREMVDACLGTNFFYYREPFGGNGDIPNGVISRYPILAAGSWTDTVQTQPNRGFAWAQIDVPGTNDLYVVSVHLLTTSASNRAAEAANLKTLMQNNFPANAWIVLAGDFNAGTRTEACITTFSGYLTDFPIPVDNLGNSDTSENRDSPHDYVLPSVTFTNFETATVLPSHSFATGLVFDSRIYTPLTDVPPVMAADSGNAQHMAVMKDFLISADGNFTNPPGITAGPQSQIVSPGSNATFSVIASGTAPLYFQWLFNGTNISGATATTFTITNAQFTNTGNYSVIVTNIAGTTNSSNALLTVSNQPPVITAPPQSQTVFIGDSPVFNVTANGSGMLAYQWRFNGTNISGANAISYTRNNVQTNDAGNYTVVITNLAGAVTSAPPAVLTVISTNQLLVIAQWNFNSITPDTNTASGSTTPSVGTGSAMVVGGITPSFVAGSTDDPAAAGTDNSAWTTTGYPAQGTGNKTAGVQFNVSTVGRQNILITWDQRDSNTGSKYVRLQYTTNGANFIDFPNATSVASNVFESKTNNLGSFPSVNNNPNFAFRIVAEFENTAANTLNTNYVGAVGSYGTGGTIRFDMVTVSGSSTGTPVSAVLSAPVFAPGSFQFLVTGSAGVNYSVQTTTNLGANNWTSVFTNPSPFTFTDTNSGTAQKFYRALGLP